jgi:hypothetical protein
VNAYRLSDNEFRTAILSHQNSKFQASLQLSKLKVTEFVTRKMTDYAVVASIFFMCETSCGFSLNGTQGLQAITEHQICIGVLLTNLLAARECDLDLRN